MCWLYMWANIILDRIVLFVFASMYKLWRELCVVYVSSIKVVES